jgi:membrane protease YdiL (CAAX protease family)
MKQDMIVEQHSLGKSVLLHLLPGLLIGLCYFALLPLFHQWGYPSMMALITALLLILVPFELGYLLYQGKQKNGRFSLEGIVLYRTPIPVRQYFIWVPVVFLIMGAIFTLMKPVDGFLQNKLFAWMPMLEGGLEGGFSKGALIVTYGMLLVVGAVVGPIVEEFYFRGYLLPRMKYAGRWAPILHTFLFALYHVWTPWMFVTRTIAMLPIVFAVQRRNLNTGIFAHIIINLVDVVAGVGFIVSMTGAG